MSYAAVNNNKDTVSSKVEGKAPILEVVVLTPTSELCGSHTHYINTFEKLKCQQVITIHVINKET